MTTKGPRWNDIRQGAVPKLRHIAQSVATTDHISDGNYLQLKTEKEKFWCHVVPLNIHQRYQSKLHNSFAIVCNIGTEVSDLCVWDNKYLKVTSRIQPINNIYGYFFTNEVTANNLTQTNRNISQNQMYTNLLIEKINKVFPCYIGSEEIAMNNILHLALQNYTESYEYIYINYTATLKNFIHDISGCELAFKLNKELEKSTEFECKAQFDLKKDIFYIKIVAKKG